MDNYFVVLIILLAGVAVSLFPGLLVILISKVNEKNTKFKLVKYLVPLCYLIIYTFLYFGAIGSNSYIIREFAFIFQYYFGVEFALSLIICFIIDIKNKKSN